ncbi:EXD2-like protein [Mya arenaria]|uniref:EXD2-like protein n=1 Tax=Mya arenaria TaxID=6604 RepID=A0ABY7FHY4_MYAAR|nr:EXD2-like protein [Mya arenaria]
MYFVSHELGWKTYVGKPQNFNELSLSLPQQLVNSCALACKRPVPQPVPECSTLPNLQHQDGRYTTVKEVLGNVKYGRHYVLRILKVGVASRDDGRKLFKDYGLAVSGCVDLRHIISRVNYAADDALVGLDVFLQLVWLKFGDVADKVSDDPFTVKLRFEPKNRRNIKKDNNLQKKESMCVVCGSYEDCVRKQVVPQEYRKALFRNLGRIPEERVAHLENTVKNYCGVKSLSDKLLKDAIDMDTKNHSFVSPPMSSPGSPANVTFNFFLRAVKL